MGIRFITKGEWLSKYADTFLYLGSISTIFGLMLAFLTDGGLAAGLVLTVIGVSCIIFRLVYVISQGKHIDKANIDKIKLLCKCSLEDAELIYQYVVRAKRGSELYQATEEKKIVAILCQSTPYALHEKIPCVRLSDIFSPPQNQPQKVQKTYTCAEVSELCGVSVSTIRKWIRDGLLNASKYANMYVISHDDLLNYAIKFDPNLKNKLQEK